MACAFRHCGVDSEVYDVCHRERRLRIKKTIVDLCSPSPCALHLKELPPIVCNWSLYRQLLSMFLTTMCSSHRCPQNARQALVRNVGERLLRLQCHLRKVPSVTTRQKDYSIMATTFIPEASTHLMRLDCLKLPMKDRQSSVN